MLAMEPVPQLHVGCPSWAHRPWVGRFLPADTRPGTELYAYSRRVNAVEGNTTFYASPQPARVVPSVSARARAGMACRRAWVRRVVVIVVASFGRSSLDKREAGRRFP